MPPLSPEELRLRARQELQKVLDSFGFAYHIGPPDAPPEKQLILRGQTAPLQILCDDVMVSGEGRIVSLQVIVAFGGDHSKPVIIESMAGLGDDFDHSIGLSATQWGFSVFLAAWALCDENACPAHMANVERLHFDTDFGAQKPFRLVSSPALSMAFGQGEESEEAKAPPELKEEFAAFWPRLARDGRPHFLKAFAMDLGDQRQTDCTVDGLESSEGKAVLARSEKLPKSAMTRQFFILWPDFEISQNEISQQNAAAKISPAPVQSSKKGWLGRIFGGKN